VVPSANGAVVLLPFPFSDLSQSKLRPAVVLANAGRGDWVLCQITSNAYGDPLALTLDQSDFATGSLRVQSFARPGKLFTANEALFTSEVGVLTPAALARVVGAVINLLKP
jgi:mRNA interferase MazF